MLEPFCFVLCLYVYSIADRSDTLLATVVLVAFDTHDVAVVAVCLWHNYIAEVAGVGLDSGSHCLSFVCVSLYSYTLVYRSDI